METRSSVQFLYFLIADQQVKFEKLHYMSLFFGIHNQQNMYISSLSETLRACLHGGGGPQVGEVNRFGV